MENKTHRSRIIYLIFVLITIIVGLSSRMYPEFFPAKILQEYSGDILWSAMVYFGLCVIFPFMKIKNLIFISSAFSYFIEITQLYHAPWIDSIRATRIGGLILGFGFLWSDLICYTIGVLFASLVDFIQLKIISKQYYFRRIF